MRNVLIAASVLLLPACGVDISTDGRVLRPDDVQGVYRLCTLRFTPVQTILPAVDLFARVIDPAPAAPAQGASLTLSGAAPEFELVYTHRGDGALRQVRGDVEFGSGSVFLYLTSQSPTIIQQEALLPPNHLDLEFHAASRTLTAGDEVSGYYVRTSDYVRAAGIGSEGLQDRILGHVTASFAAGTCG
ncbi:MAG: hypothetical protein ACJ8GN_25925 [Longimicrobiaceae bacterium]